MKKQKQKKTRDMIAIIGLVAIVGMVVITVGYYLAASKAGLAVTDSPPEGVDAGIDTTIVGTQSSRLARLTYPSGSTMESSTVLKWTTGTNVDRRWLYIGTYRGGKNILAREAKGLQTNVAIPSSKISSIVYIRLWSRTGGRWLRNDYAFKITDGNNPNCIGTPEWKTGPWGTCTIPCGPQVVSRKVWCEDESGKTVADSLCDAKTRPASSKTIDCGVCQTYHWDVGPYNPCVCTGVPQTRTIVCKDQTNRTVADSYCKTTKPATSRNCTVTLKDGSGNTYGSVWVKQGGYGRCWQATDMIARHYGDGSGKNIYARCQSGSNCQYSWHVASVLCPAGWHLPTKNEWHALEMAFKNSTASCPASRNDNWNISPYWQCSNAGTDLKAGGSSGLDLLLNGRHSPTAGFQRNGWDGYFWTSTSVSSSQAKRYCVTKQTTAGSHTKVSQLSWYKDWGFSVRCIKN